ncbi:hypothetical protein V5F49_06515 [Xanthobacter sp. V3C-3]|uniref:hypothetical protein n=1 Tax=Xanthobacter lutulentifluminis TaxID=3119935 RepID=UPI003727FB91
MTPARLALAVLAALLVSPAAAQPAQDPDWPCVQRRTPSIDLAQVWNGPDPAAAGKWTDDQDAATLAQRLASRRTPLEDVDGLLDAYSRQAGAGARDGLLRVMAGVYEILNTERSRIVSGIERYARGQQKLADRIREEGDKVSAAKASGAATPEAASLEEQLKWDSRIFDERARSLTYVCETPVLLEQRAYAIGEKIAARLNGR